MAITDNFILKLFNKKEIVEQVMEKIPVEGKTNIRPEAFQGRILFTHSYDGEKNLGEIGPVKSYALDYQRLRMRSWQSYLESEITQTVINRFKTWVIGTGLKLQTMPNLTVLKYENLIIDQQFNENIEARFDLYAKSKNADYAGMRSLNTVAKRAFVNSILGGDVLVVLRLIEGNVKVQLIDGCHVSSPRGGTEYFPEMLGNGNCIKNGIEIAPNGEHIAYYVRDINYAFERIPAKGENSKMLVAYLVIGSEYRLDNVRGMPLISTVLETMAKLERYKEATVGSAEEREKIAYAIEHKLGSTGENPYLKQMAVASGYSNNELLPIDSNGNQLSNTVAATTNKQIVNLPVEATIKSLESKSELHFGEFYTVNINLICAAIGIPPEVALSKYDSNFSASRAALKDWEHTLNVKRNDFADQFLQPIYNFWMEVNILNNKIQAPGYITARLKGNDIVCEAYRACRWVGAPVPHIDPLKEVAAARLKLGDTGASIPLTTVEAATESLNGGEAYENINQYAKELASTKKLGIVIEMPVSEPIKKLP